MKERMSAAAMVWASVLAMTLAGCSLGSWEISTGALPIQIEAETFLIAWDSTEPVIPELSSAISHFNLYYREMGAKEWNELKSSSCYATQLTVSRSDFGTAGKVEVGIEEVYNDGTTSEIHKSTDFAAKPYGGWYLEFVN